MGTPAADSASIAAVTSTRPPPLPPYSSGTPSPSRPCSPIAVHISSGNLWLCTQSMKYARP